ncbi:MAG: glycosyltransferase, partial [Anaerolineales bacterium]
MTFNPDPEFPGRIRAIAEQVESVLIIDNASGPQGQALLTKLEPSKHLEIILNPDNVGVATALNIGMNRARTLRYQWALALDQDSDAAPNMVAELTRVIQTREWAERAA